ncbi:hypothetical protein [Peribacillus simplex]
MLEELPENPYYSKGSPDAVPKTAEITRKKWMVREKPDTNNKRIRSEQW